MENVNHTTKATDAEVHSFKVTLFIWEVIITAIIFTAAYFILKNYKKKEKIANEKNSKYSTGG